MSYSNSFPTQRPSLNLVFNGGSDQLDSRISYSRSSSGTAFSSERHLSSENLLFYSNDLSQGAWTKARVTVASTNNTAPDGTATASSVLEDTSTDSHTFYDNFNCVNGQQYSFVFYAKANGRTKVSISPQATAVIATVQFDLTAVTSTVISGSADSHSITAIGTTGWFKCAVTVTATGTGTGYSQVNLRDASGNSSYTGDATKGVYIWGNQVSSTGETVLNETSGSIHRSFAPTLKSYSSDQPRFEFDASGNAEGLLVESQSTNYVPNSELDAGYSMYRLTASTNACVGPTGTLAQVFTETNDSGSRYLANSLSTSLDYSTTYTASVYAKKVASGTTDSRIKLRINGMGGDAYAGFDLVNGTVTQQAGSAIDSATISSVGNGWYRISMTWTNESADRPNGIIVAFNNNTASSLADYVGDGFTSYALAGLMVEEGASPSSLIQTTGSSVTRAADSCSVATSDINLTSSQDVTLLVEGDYGDPAVFANNRFAAALGRDSQSYISLYNGAGESGSGYIRTNGPTEFYTQSGVTSGNFKAAISAKNNSVKYAANGTSFAEDTDAELPEYTELKVGGQFVNNRQINGTISRVSIYSQALSSSELAALTS